ncbi:MAG TPA: amidohydrolase family protein [Dehalococcoidia bacterium]|nr:amidohydrolase family protein [Dehalococcoidia bacterium]
MEICDIHHHLGALIGGSLQEGEGWMDRDYASRVAMMDANKVDFAGILAATGYIQADGIKATMRSNDAVAEYRKRDPKRFRVAAGIVEPLHGVASLDELDRIKHELQLDGVVWHHRFQGLAVDSPLMRPLLKRVSELGLVPFLHTNAESNLEAAWRLERWANEFPELTFIGMDALHGNAHGQMTLEIAKRTPNIIWDTSGARNPRFLLRFVEEAGSEKLVLGSTYYSYPPSYRSNRELEVIRESGMREEDLANVLAGNMKRLRADIGDR